MRKVHIKVPVQNLDGCKEASVELRETPTGDFVIGVRPKGRRIEYTGLMSDVVMIVASRHAKALLSAQGIGIPKARK